MGLLLKIIKLTSTYKKNHVSMSGLYAKCSKTSISSNSRGFLELHENGVDDRYQNDKIYIFESLKTDSESSKRKLRDRCGHDRYGRFVTVNSTKLTT